MHVNSKEQPRKCHDPIDNAINAHTKKTHKKILF